MPSRENDLPIPLCSNRLCIVNIYIRTNNENNNKLMTLSTSYGEQTIQFELR